MLSCGTFQVLLGGPRGPTGALSSRLVLLCLGPAQGITVLCTWRAEMLAREYGFVLVVLFTAHERGYYVREF